MSAKHIPDISEFKQQAHALRVAFANQGKQITYMEALHQVALKNHFRSWEMLKAKWAEQKDPVSLNLTTISSGVTMLRKSDELPVNVKEPKFGLVALKAVELGICGGNLVEAWNAATVEIFPESLSSQRKGCPRSTFLGLAEAGLIIGIAPGNYTKSQLNKRYALNSYAVLRNNGEYAANPKALWLVVMELEGVVKAYNHQMDVVVALWRAKKLIRHDA